MTLGQIVELKVKNVSLLNIPLFHSVPNKIMEQRLILEIEYRENKKHS